MRVACILFAGEVALSEFAQACIRFSPQIALREPNVIFIEIGKCRHLYSEESFLLRIKVLLRRFNYAAKVRVGDDIPSTLCMTLFESESTGLLPLDSLVEYADPFVRDLDGRKSIIRMVHALGRLGIKNIDRFKTLPSQQFPSRFGSLGLFCRQQVEQGDKTPWPFWIPPDRWLEQVEIIESDFCNDLEPLLFKSKTILDRLFSRLRGKFLRADQIQFVIEQEKYSTITHPQRTWTFDLISPQGSTSGFLPILRERLNWDLSKEPIEAPVTLIRVEALSTSVGSSSQRHFFHSQEEFNEQMGALFGQLEELLGRGQVFWASLTEDRFPERSWKKLRKSEEQQLSLEGRYPKRPTRLFKSPLPITVIQDRIVLKGHTVKVRSWSSIERLSLDWLDATPSRNYYRIEPEKGPVLWIFSDPSHHYFLHGYYE